MSIRHNAGSAGKYKRRHSVRARIWQPARSRLPSSDEDSVDEYTMVSCSGGDGLTQLVTVATQTLESMYTRNTASYEDNTAGEDSDEDIYNSRRYDDDKDTRSQYPIEYRPGYNVHIEAVQNEMKQRLREAGYYTMFHSACKFAEDLSRAGNSPLLHSQLDPRDIPRAVEQYVPFQEFLQSYKQSRTGSCEPQGTSSWDRVYDNENESVHTPPSTPRASTNTPPCTPRASIELDADREVDDDYVYVPYTGGNMPELYTPMNPVLRSSLSSAEARTEIEGAVFYEHDSTPMQTPSATDQNGPVLDSEEESEFTMNQMNVLVDLVPWSHDNAPQDSDGTLLSPVQQLHKNFEQFNRCFKTTRSGRKYN